jgi:hypothetical protein
VFVSTAAVGVVGVPVNAGLVPKDVKADDVLVEVNKVAEAGIVVLFTEVTFGNKVVAVVTKVLEAGIVVLFTNVTFGNEVVDV